MGGTRAKCLLTTVLLSACAIPASAGDYRDPTGFSFTYPDGWMAVTEPGKGLNNNAFSPQMRDWLKKNKLDFKKVRVALLRNGKSGAVDNLNVVIDAQNMPVDDATMRQLRDMTAQQYRSLGVRIEKLDGRLQTFDRNKAIVLDFQAQWPGEPHFMKTKQVFFSGAGNTYIVTCTGRADSFTDHEKSFDTILESFDIPAQNPQKTGDLVIINTNGIGSGSWKFLGIDWSRTFTAGIIGGAIGLLVGLIKKFAG